MSATEPELQKGAGDSTLFRVVVIVSAAKQSGMYALQGWIASLRSQ